MEYNKRLYEIELIGFQLPDNPIQINYGAKFKNKLKPQDYGVQRFISEKGEISVMNFLVDGFQEEYLDIKQVLEEVVNTRRMNKIFKGSWLGVNDAVRYFSDLSPQGHIWFWEYMRILDPVLLNKAKIISKKTKISENQQITFNNWFSLTKKEKVVYINTLLDNPIDGSESIPVYYYD